MRPTAYPDPVPTDPQGTPPTAPPPLFTTAPRPRTAAIEPVDPRVQTGHADTTLTAEVDDRVIDLFEKVNDPDDPLALRDLFLARVEAELPAGRSEVAQTWSAARRRRTVTADEVTHSRTTVRFVKELFNAYFRDDLYGRLRSDSHVILSSGSVDETVFGLPEALRACIEYAVDRDWYGYSDSRGRRPSREAVAAYENTTVSNAPYDVDNVCLTMGGTFAVSAVADFLLGLKPSEGAAPALCAVPNYPPLLEAVARRHPVRLVPLECGPAGSSLQPLLDAMTPATPLVLLQTVTNPTSTAIPEAEIERLLRTAAPHTVVLLDEAHECLGPAVTRSEWRAAPHVVRLVSLSKSFSVPGLKLGWLMADAGFVSEFYEYASTSYGSPPSVFYLFIEVMARLERWRREGRERLGPEQLAEFEPVYGLTLRVLDEVYQDYCRERTWRDTTLVDLREATVARLRTLGFEVVQPTHSINAAVRPPGCDDGYRWFRSTLARVGVAAYPGTLNACLGGGWVRMTTARHPNVIDEAIRRLSRVNQS
jgi:aspartate/methionine/tyrosine aminotransferase